MAKKWMLDSKDLTVVDILTIEKLLNSIPVHVHTIGGAVFDGTWIKKLKPYVEETKKVPLIGQCYNHKDGNVHEVVKVFNEYEDGFKTNVLYKNVVTGVLWYKPLSYWQQNVV